MKKLRSEKLRADFSFPSIARICLCKSKRQGDLSHHLEGARIFLRKYRAIWGIAANIIAISRDMGQGLGRKLLLTLSGEQVNPCKADCGYCDSISQNAHPASTLELS